MTSIQPGRTRQNLWIVRVQRSSGKRICLVWVFVSKHRHRQESNIVEQYLKHLRR